MKKKKIKLGKIAILFFACVFVCMFTIKYATLKNYRDEIDSLKAQTQEQKEYGKQLDEISKEYDSDEYVEKYARSLGLVKPNEKIFRNYNDKK